MAAGWGRKFVVVAMGLIFLCSVCMDKYGSFNWPTESVFRDKISDDPCGWKCPLALGAPPAVVGNGLKWAPAAESPTSGADVAGVVILRRSGECVDISVPGCRWSSGLLALPGIPLP